MLRAAESLPQRKASGRSVTVHAHSQSNCPGSGSGGQGFEVQESGRQDWCSESWVGRTYEVEMAAAWSPTLIGTVD